MGKGYRTDQRQSTYYNYLARGALAVHFQKLWVIITARKRSLRRLCFYTCLSFILFTAGVSGIRPPGRHPPVGRHPAGPSTHPWADNPPGTKYTPPSQDTVNAGAVRILLECKLVLFCTLCLQCTYKAMISEIARTWNSVVSFQKRFEVV